MKKAHCAEVLSKPGIVEILLEDWKIERKMQTVQQNK